MDLSFLTMRDMCVGIQCHHCFECNNPISSLTCNVGGCFPIRLPALVLSVLWRNFLHYPITSSDRTSFISRTLTRNDPKSFRARGLFVSAIKDSKIMRLLPIEDEFKRGQVRVIKRTDATCGDASTRIPNNSYSSSPIPPHSIITFGDKAENVKRHHNLRTELCPS
jgi:hypothetical protein